MIINGVTIEDTFAEAFTMRVARIVISGKTARWAREAALKLTGFATSVIGCKCEAGIERELTASETPDRSEEHTSELQSPCNLVCRLLLEKKKNKLDDTMEQAHTIE